MLGVILVLALLTHVGYRLFRRCDLGVGVELSYFPTLYGFFFALYHLLPYLSAVVAGTVPQRNHLWIAFLFLLAYGGWNVGIYFSPLRSRRHIPVRWASDTECRSLLILTLLCMSLVAIAFIHRAVTGTLNTHAAYFEQEATVEASVLNVVGQELQFPTLLLLGFLCWVRHPRIALLARRLFYGYSAVLFLTYLPASQTRPAITVLILVAFTLGLYRPFLLRPGQTLGLALAGVAAVLFIQISRLEAVEGGVVQAEVAENVRSRASGGALFLSDIIDARASHAPLYGSLVVGSLPLLIPRVLWPDKPVVEPIKLEVQRQLDLPVGDTGLTSVCQFYADGGTLGVAAGHFFVGLLMGALMTRLVRRPGFCLLFVFFFLWCQLIQMEQELVIGSLSTLRTALLVYCLFRLICSITARFEHRAVDVPAPPIIPSRHIREPGLDGVRS